MSAKNTEYHKMFGVSRQLFSDTERGARLSTRRSAVCYKRFTFVLKCSKIFLWLVIGLLILKPQ